ncbi:O-antigen ligase family protein [Nostoc sp. C052]|uniref:O-antigen ligase family protein n=1 Tax=Nostoc sp. C052 TaxID=2576902 RepID=UPI0015C3F4AB|nr:O-antigen ligase family protein [Nostoc sp. C052]QLE40894.1 O-antigen ligase family protein [Nostoc sp. C052]
MKKASFLPDEITPTSLWATKWLFVGMCFYMISQVYVVPLLAIGPSWSLWPNLSDFACFFMIVAFVLAKRTYLEVSQFNLKLLSILLVAFVGSIISYIFYRLNLGEENTPGIAVGQYQIYRFIQFICIFWITAHVPFSSTRRKILIQINDLIFLLVCLGIILTFFNILPLGALTIHLPQEPTVAGAWSRYQSIGKYGGQGWGTTGYDHSHVAVNVIMLLAMRMHLAQSDNIFVDKLFLLIGVITCFFTESRTGLAAILVFGILYWIKRPQYTTKILFVFLSLAALLLVYLSNVGFNSLHIASSEGSLLERQAGLTSVDADSLSGRDEIWKERIEMITNNPEILFLGSGFGAATDTGKKAHFLLLHITLETGLIGLSIFIYFFAHVFYYLYIYECDAKTIFLATICFFISALGQDTLYFTVTFVHFTGFYLYGVAIVLQNSQLYLARISRTKTTEKTKDRKVLKKRF